MLSKLSSLAIVITFLFIGGANINAQTCYVTKTGTKYHQGSCSYLSHSAQPLSLEKAISYGYHPCSRCIPNQANLLRNNYTPKSTYTVTRGSSCSTVVCSGWTQSGRSCRNKTKDCSGRCHHHR